MLKSADKAWCQTINHVLHYGTEMASRNGSMKEVLNDTTKINMNEALITIPERKINYKLMAAGALWHITGSNRVADLSCISSTIGTYYDGPFAYGAYGPKFVHQLPYIIDSLTDQSHSRQAVINIWTENPQKGYRDTSCLVSLQVLIRDNKLNLIANMRSSDIWMGLPYDLFDYSIMALYIALLLREYSPYFEDLKLGTMYLNAGSSHIYNNFEAQCHKVVCNIPPHDLQQNVEVSDFDLVSQFTDSNDLIFYLNNCKDEINLLGSYHD